LEPLLNEWSALVAASERAAEDQGFVDAISDEWL
jgi:hypothetical protein